MTRARFTTNYTRIGGLSRDVPPGWVEQCRKFLDEVQVNFDETDKLLARNRIIMDRNQEIGVLPKEVAIDYCGFRVREGFLVGYGLDYAEKYRYLPDICVIE